ncbi:MAG: endonuclease/exonuclease/phosphatase family protein [Kiritimatiellae bacterium]|jgi:endonuclease/exonuclease/phosphatase (EEP) superfamily protein YafD|nr:endonuclease/exonuclease/phosphatase family protein [Kiritimatiellia bacterium]
MSQPPKGNKFHLLCRLALGLLSVVLIIGTALPFLRSDAWWIRGFDFPRIQIAILIVLSLTGYALLHLYKHLRSWEVTLAAVLGMGLIWQLIAIAPYTVFYPHEMSESPAGDTSNRIAILVFNVLADNREVEALRTLIRDTDPDIVLLSEPTQWWLDQLDGLEADYPYTLFQPQENNYGLLLYSKLELVNPEIQFLIEHEIPSIRTGVQLRSGTVISLYGVHPRPPGIHRLVKEFESGIVENEGEEDEDGNLENTDMRDAELLSVAKEIKELGDVPVIVAGDFNDVAWSRSTHLFQRTGGLLDPRVGRGLFNTWDSGNWLLRYPLDHVFASRHFFLVELQRLPDIGSDHFPILVVLDYDSGSSVENDAPQPKAGDEEEAEEAIEKGKAND